MGDPFLSHGWKVFARGRNLVPGDLISFWYDGWDALTLKFFCMHGDRKECCPESSSSGSSGDEGDDASSGQRTGEDDTSSSGSEEAPEDIKAEVNVD